MRGKLITIEGIDGGGKRTQAEMLVKKLTALSIKAKIYSFPCYQGTFFGKEIGAFLRGEFGTIEQVHPKLAALLFAGDRFVKKDELLDDLSNGTYVVCDRYVESNIAHQCAKLPTEQWPDFIRWVEQLEYDIYQMPKPDCIIFLDVPPTISKTLVLTKDKRTYTDAKEDIHEGAYDYLQSTYGLYQYLQAKKGWLHINCIEAQKIRGVADISNELVTQVLKLTFKPRQK